MNEIELRQFSEKRVEAVLMDYRMVLKGTLQGVDKGYVKFSSIDELFVLVHGKRLSLKLMLAASFSDLEALLNNLLFPCRIFDKCKVAEE
jgi:hypothetical protein